MIAMFCVVASGGCGGGGCDGSSSTDDYIDEPENPEPNIPNEPSNLLFSKSDFEKTGSYYRANNSEEATSVFFWDRGTIRYTYRSFNRVSDKWFSLVENKLTKENYIISDNPTGNLHSTTFELVNDSKIIYTDKDSKTEEDYLLIEITFER